jgi:uncharacterized membrane protein YebE (DUF533 family)
MVYTPTGKQYSYPYHKVAMLQAQRSYIEGLVDICGGDIADMLIVSGLSRMHLYRVLKMHGLADLAYDSRDAYNNLKRAKNRVKEVNNDAL